MNRIAHFTSTAECVEHCRASLNARTDAELIRHANWWAKEARILRVYLVKACWLAKPGAVVDNNMVKQMAARDWRSIPEELRNGIVNEMHRVCLSAKVMEGK